MELHRGPRRRDEHDLVDHGLRRTHLLSVRPVEQLLEHGAEPRAAFDRRGARLLRRCTVGRVDPGSRDHGARRDRVGGLLGSRRRKRLRRRGDAGTSGVLHVQPLAVLRWQRRRRNRRGGGRRRLGLSGTPDRDGTSARRRRDRSRRRCRRPQPARRQRARAAVARAPAAVRPSRTATSSMSDRSGTRAARSCSRSRSRSSSVTARSPSSAGRGPDGPATRRCRVGSPRPRRSPPRNNPRRSAGRAPPRWR